ncbi:PAAR-like domain-containing protein, partial [Desulfonatronospira sp.]|uniref:PAAR-like domain-containing protein n=1 Tax=Desulfonatronospira sp. TaxID=1962951 RepID=UPI0025BACFE2
KKGIITSKIKGKIYFTSWSMDVKFEGKNVVRHLDLTTHNHSSQPGQTPPWPHIDSVAEETDSKCEKLEQTNNDSREALKDKTSDKTLVGQTGEGEGTTVSSMNFGESITVGHNRKTARERYGIFVEGGDMEKRHEGKSNLCPDANHTHGKPSAQKSGHAEAKLLDELFKTKSTSGKATFNIDWRKKNGKKSKTPCLDCYKMMCAAKSYEISVFICDKNGKEHKIDCPANKENWIALDELLN